MSPGHTVAVQVKWHSINFIDSMEIFVGFNHVSSCSSVVEAWRLKDIGLNALMCTVISFKTALSVSNFKFNFLISIPVAVSGLLMCTIKLKH